MSKSKPKPKQPAKTAAKSNPHVEKKKASAASRGKDWQWWLLGAAAVVITFIVLKGTLSLQFVNWDDPDNLLLNENLRIFSYSWDWASIKKIFTTDIIGNYNPLPIFTFAIEKYFFSPDPVKAPFIYHFDNLWMHGMCTFLVFILFTQMGFGRIPAFIGALLFGIHPMRVESVAWITERKDVLYGMFFLASLSAYVAYLKSKSANKGWYVLAIVLSIFSYFAKIQAVTLPLTMVAMDFYFKRKWSSPKILILEKLPWWILSLACGLVNIYFLKQQKSLNLENSAKMAYTVVDRLAVGAYAYATYLIKWIVPFKMSPLYPYPPKLPWDAYAALAVVPIAIAAFLFWAIRKKKNDLLFGWAFFTVNVMFLLQIVGAGQGFLADRFTYIAYIGLFFILIKGYDWMMEHRPRYKVILLMAAVMYLAIFAIVTFRQVKVWENSETLWEYVKVYFPNSPLAWKQAGNYYRDEKKDFSKALLNYNEAVRLEPTDAYVYNSVAKIYMDKAFSLDPQKDDYANEKQSLVRLAIQNYDQSITRDSINGMPDKKQAGETIVNRGVAYAVLGDMQKSLQDLGRGLDINPNNTNGYLNRGLIYFNQNEWELSLKDHDKYIALDPYNPDIFHERALCYIGLEQPAKALPDFDRAIFLKADQPLYYIWRSKALRMLGKTDAAIKDAQRARQLGGQVPEDMLH